MQNNRTSKMVKGGPIAIVKKSNGTLQLSSDHIKFISPVKVTVDTGTVKVFQKQDKEWKELKQSKSKNGYIVVFPKCEYKSGKRCPHNIYVHRLVASAFCDNPRGVQYVDHIDGDRENNNPSNLRWVTMKENQLYRRIHELKKMKAHNRGEVCNSRKQGRILKLTRHDCSNPLFFDTIAEAGRAIGCTGQNISMCIKRGFKPVGYTVEYVEKVG